MSFFFIFASPTQWEGLPGAESHHLRGGRVWEHICPLGGAHRASWADGLTLTHTHVHTDIHTALCLSNFSL